MSICFFVSDLHGHPVRYNNLFQKIVEEKPAAVFMGGDLLPSGLFALTSASETPEDFVNNFVVKHLEEIKSKLGKAYPRFFLIMGNDDARMYESLFQEANKRGLIEYVHNRKVSYENYFVYGYAYVPPTPFMLKDWERYDVSRYVDPGCTPPEEGSFSVEVNKKNLQYETIQKDLEQLTGDDDLSKSIFLFHAPPYKSNLDRANLDGRTFEHVPLDVHVGSIAIERFISNRQPMITLHGHIHESTSVTGHWKQEMGNTLAMNAAHDGEELSLVRFNPEDLSSITRELI